MILPLQGKQRISPLERNGCSTQGLSRLSGPWPRNPSPHQLRCMHNSTAQQRYVHKSMNCSIVLKSKNCNCWIWLGVYLQKLHPSIWKNIIYPLPWWLYKLWKSKITKWPVCVDCSSENPNLWFVTGSELETECLWKQSVWEQALGSVSSAPPPGWGKWAAWKNGKIVLIWE